MSCDPYFSQVSLLLTCDGANGSTTFPDSSQYANAMTTISPAVVDDSNPKFGTGAMSLGAGFGAAGAQCATGGAGGPFDMGAGDFTVEFWFFFPSNPGYGTYLGGDGNGTTGQIGLTFDNSGSGNIVGTASSGGNAYIASASVPSYAAWHSVAFVKSGLTITMYVDGVAGSPYTMPAGSPNAVNSTFVVGSTTAYGNKMPGEIDEFRVTKGVARYLSNYTPAFAAFPPNPCSGYAQVPDLFNVSEAIAIAELEALGLVAGTISTQSDVLVIPGNVDAQAVAAGTYVPDGTAINFTVSSGRGPVAVPDLLGLTQAQAITALLNVGLVPGAIGFAPSISVPAGIVSGQDVGPGIPFPIYLSSGSIVAFVVSTGPVEVPVGFDYGPTVISQYANSPTLLQWLDNMNQYLDQAENFAQFYVYVWNVETAQGFGLDILGRIVNVSRLLNIPGPPVPYVGFYIDGEGSAQDWQPMGNNQGLSLGGDGALYTGHNATTAYLLTDTAYRQLILAKAFANICATTAPALNQILQNLYGAGAAWVSVTGIMSIAYNFNFTPTIVQLAILTQSGVIPTPPGVAVTIVHP